MLPWSAGPLSPHAAVAFSWKTSPSILNDNLAQSYYKTPSIPHAAAPKMQTAADTSIWDATLLFVLWGIWKQIAILLGIVVCLWAPWKAVSIEAKAISCQVCVCVWIYLCCWSCLCDALGTSCACSSWITLHPVTCRESLPLCYSVASLCPQWLNKVCCMVRLTVHRNPHICRHAFYFFLGMSGNNVCFSTDVSCRISRIFG